MTASGGEVHGGLMAEADTITAEAIVGGAEIGRLGPSWWSGTR